MSFSSVPSKPGTKTKQVGELRNGDKIVVKITDGQGFDFYLSDVVVDWPATQAAPKYSYEHPTDGLIILNSRDTVEALDVTKVSTPATKKSGRFWFLRRQKQKI